MKIGYNQATSLGCSTLEKDLVLCEKVGFDFIEIRIDQLKEYLKENSLDDLIEFFNNNKIKPHAINAIYFYSDLFSDNDLYEKQNEFMKEFIWTLEVCNKIQSNHVIVVTPFEEPEYLGTREKATVDAVRILTRLSDVAEKYSVKLCYELVGLPKSGVKTIEHAQEIINKVNKDNVGYVLDAFNIFCKDGDDDFKEITQLDVDKIFIVHINDSDNVGPQNDQNPRCFVGEGRMNLNNFIANLRKIDYTGVVSIEVFRPSYWEKDPEWVIEKAYKTTYPIVNTNGNKA